MNLATCPVCSGTGRVPAGDTPHKAIRWGYEKATDTLTCSNCGGQTMGGQPTGKVRTRTDGTPCTHQYASSDAGRCVTAYTCQHCGDSYQIDSSD